MEIINETKKFIIPVAVLITAFYLPVSFLVGIISGFLITVWFHKKFIEPEKVDLVIFNIGNWEVHLHHWVMGLLIFLAIYMFGVLPEISFFWIGALCGMIVHDLYTDDIWYKVIYKNRSEE